MNKENKLKLFIIKTCCDEPEIVFAYNEEQAKSLAKYLKPDDCVIAVEIPNAPSRVEHY